jgi:hypothetical protein
VIARTGDRSASLLDAQPTLNGHTDSRRASANLMFCTINLMENQRDFNDPNYHTRRREPVAIGLLAGVRRKA